MKKKYPGKKNKPDSQRMRHMREKVPAVLLKLNDGDVGREGKTRTSGPSIPQIQSARRNNPL